ncbi:MAG: hypothetical protein AB8B64_22185 [Granulosicoccus sp.]
MNLRVHVSTVAYATQVGVLLNPERGLMKFLIVGNDSIVDIGQLRSDSHTVVWGTILLEPYRNTPIIPAAKLAEITNWLAALKRNTLASL